MPPKRKKSLVECSTESPAPDDNFDVASVASVPSTASATPVKPKAKKPKVEKGEKVEKVKAPPKAKAFVKEKVPAKDKEVKGKSVIKEVKETKEIKEAKDIKVMGKDGKEKVKAVTGDEAQEVLLEYLSRENRPFSAGDISGNLHGKVTKTLTDKLLKELCNSGLINGKGTNGDGKGSQWVYWALQDPNSSLSPEQLAEMDSQIQDLQGRLPELKMDARKLNIQLAGMKKEMGVQELKDKIEKLEEGKREKEERLRELREGKDVVRKEEVERVEREFAYWGKMRGVRKRGFEGVEGMLLEGMSREDVWEKAGIEGEEEGVL
ncbi:putative tbp1-interacting protein tbpip protein [Botrytis fragariae]|uniref:Putative tbp1-interacting protein tbpip protein n=1 Tax=Botrytis fragariae TaxID=1964551 RepID=A0A8H6ANF6_9HELO|nr:putative tbp1-interacting protein tbpip protein [Botrytis fragariae]KAF5870727.1 putative tbp1-interacting protein tbpip protein [Botrytis fragariae]